MDKSSRLQDYINTKLDKIIEPMMKDMKHDKPTEMVKSNPSYFF